MAARLAPSKGGKPDKLIRDALMVAVSRETVDDQGKKIKYINLIAAKLVSKAAGGDVAAIKEVSDRIDGKPAQQLDLGTGGGPVQLVVSWRKE